MPYAFQGGTFLQPGSFRNGPGDIFVNSAGYKHVRSPDAVRRRGPPGWSR